MFLNSWVLGNISFRYVGHTIQVILKSYSRKKKRKLEIKLQTFKTCVKEKIILYYSTKIRFLFRHPTHTYTKKRKLLPTFEEFRKKIHPEVIPPLRGKTIQCSPEHWNLDRKTINGQFVDIIRWDKRRAAIWLNINGLRLYLQIRTRKSFYLRSVTWINNFFSLIKQQNFVKTVG